VTPSRKGEGSLQVEVQGFGGCDLRPRIYGLGLRQNPGVLRDMGFEICGVECWV